MQNQTMPSEKRNTNYGLPCAKCGSYYAASLTICPRCQHDQRVSPAALSPNKQTPRAF
jgi:uncharacterized OB-fold protein